MNATPANPALDFLAGVRPSRLAASGRRSTGVAGSTRRSPRSVRKRRAAVRARLDGSVGTRPNSCRAWKFMSARASACPPACTNATRCAGCSSTPCATSSVRLPPPADPVPKFHETDPSPTVTHPPQFPPGPPWPAPGRGDPNSTSSCASTPRNCPPTTGPGRARRSTSPLVLDRSGSMGGQKMEYARQAAAFAVDQLRAADRVSVVAFDNAVETVVASHARRRQGAAQGRHRAHRRARVHGAARRLGGGRRAGRLAPRGGLAQPGDPLHRRSGQRGRNAARRDCQ